MDFKDTIIFKPSTKDKRDLVQKADKMRLTLSGYVRYKLFKD